MLLWGLDYGHRTEQLETLREQGHKVPALDRKPDLDEGIAWFWEAYVTLQKGRLWIMGQPQAIALQDVLAYSGLVGLDREDTGSLLNIVRRLDDAYFERLASKAKAKSGGTGSSNRRSPRKTRG